MSTPVDEASTSTVELVDDIFPQILAELDIHGLENVSKASKPLCQMSCALAWPYLVELSRRRLKLRKAAVPPGLTYQSALEKLLASERNWMMGSCEQRTSTIFHDISNADRTFFSDRSVKQWTSTRLSLDDSQGHSILFSSSDEIWKLSVDYTQDLIVVVYRSRQSNPTATPPRTPDDFYVRFLSATDLSNILPFEADTISLGLNASTHRIILCGPPKILGSRCGLLYRHDWPKGHLVFLDWSKPTEEPVHIKIPEQPRKRHFWSFEFLDPATVVVLSAQNPVAYRLDIYRINFKTKAASHLAMLALPRLSEMPFGRPSIQLETSRRIPTPSTRKHSGPYELYQLDSGIMQVEFSFVDPSAVWLVIVIDLHGLISFTNSIAPPAPTNAPIRWKIWGPSISRIFYSMDGVPTEGPYIAGHPIGFRVPFYKSITRDGTVEKHYGILDFSPNTIAWARKMISREEGLTDACTLVRKTSSVEDNIFAERCQGRLPYLAITLGVASVASSFHLTEDRFIITSQHPDGTEIDSLLF